MTIKYVLLGEINKASAIYEMNCGETIAVSRKIGDDICSPPIYYNSLKDFIKNHSKLRLNELDEFRFFLTDKVEVLDTAKIEITVEYDGEKIEREELKHRIQAISTPLNPIKIIDIMVKEE